MAAPCLAGIFDKAVPPYEQEAKGNNLNGYAAYASSQVVATSVPQMRDQIFEGGRNQEGGLEATECQSCSSMSPSYDAPFLLISTHQMRT